MTQLKIAVNGAGGGTRNTQDQKELRVGGNGEQVIQTVTTVPGDTLNITVGGGGYSQVSGTGISIQAGGGGGASSSASTVGGVGGGTNGGAAETESDGGHAGNGLGGKGSSTRLTENDPPLKGEDGSVIISST